MSFEAFKVPGNSPDSIIHRIGDSIVGVVRRNTPQQNQQVIDVLEDIDEHFSDRNNLSGQVFARDAITAHRLNNLEQSIADMHKRIFESLQ